MIHKQLDEQLQETGKLPNPAINDAGADCRFSEIPSYRIDFSSTGTAGSAGWRWPRPEARPVVAD